MKTTQLTIEQYVDTFLSEQGISQPLKQETYWKRLSSKFGAAADRFGDCIEKRDSGVRVDPYPLKNISLDFSNAVTSQSDSSRLRKFFAWFLREGYDLNSKTILDLGCDSGIFCCFIGKLFPEARIIGIDTCAEAINLANERAERLSLTNTSFYCCDILKFFQAHAAEKFDLVTALTVFHEILNAGNLGCSSSVMSLNLNNFSIELSDNLPSKSFDNEDMKLISGLLNDDGELLSLDRWTSASQFLRWVRMCEFYNLKIDFKKSHMLSYKDTTNTVETMPVSVFQVCTERKSISRASDVLALFCYPDFAKIPSIQIIESQDIAELVYASLCKDHLYIEEATYNDGSGTMMTYVGVANGVGYIYNTTSRGYRKLFLMPSILLCERSQDIKDQRELTEKHAKVTYTTYLPDLQKNLSIKF